MKNSVNKKKSFGAGVKKFSKNYLNYTAIAVAMLVCLIMYFTTGKTAEIIMPIAIAMIMTLSLNFVVGFLGELSLGHAGFMCVGACLGAKLTKMLVAFISESFGMKQMEIKGSLPLMILFVLLSLVVGAVISAVCGFVVGFAALRLKGDYLAIVTLAFGEIVRVVFLYSSYTGAHEKLEAAEMSEGLKKFLTGLLDLVTFTEANGSFNNIQFLRANKLILAVIGFGVVLFTLLVIQNILKSKTGRAITAIRDNEIAARAMGIDVTKHKLMVFVISAAFAGMAGALYTFCNPIDLSGNAFSYNYSIEVLIMVVLGGIGSINGSLISATLITTLNLTLLKKISTWGIDPIYKDILYAVILILVIIYNNAPALKGFREKYNFKNLWTKIFKPKHDPAKDKSDAARWDVVPTKIEMNEVLSTDVVIDQSGDNNADIGERGGSK